MTIKKYLEKKCEIINKDGDEWNVRCPYCNSSEAFSFNVFKKVGQCWREKHCIHFTCNDITFVATLENISTSEASKILGYDNKEVNKSVLTEFKKHLERARKRSTVIIEEDQERFNNVLLPYNYIQYTHPSMLHTFIKGRGYDFKTIKYFKIGYCKHGKYHNRIIIPIKTDNSHSFQARRLWDKNSKRFGRLLKKDPKYKQKYLNALGSKRDYLIYNYNQKYRKPYVIVVESATSVWRLYDYGYQSIAIFGCSNISEHHIELISKLPIEFVAFCLDRDAVNKAKEQANDLAKTMDVRFIKLPDDRDPDDLSKKEVKKFIIEKMYKTKHSELKNKLLKRFKR